MYHKNDPLFLLSMYYLFKNINTPHISQQLLGIHQNCTHHPRQTRIKKNELKDCCNTFVYNCKPVTKISIE